MTEEVEEKVEKDVEADRDVEAEDENKCPTCDGPLDEEDGICHACLDSAEADVIDDAVPEGHEAPEEELARVEALEEFLKAGSGADSDGADGGGDGGSASSDADESQLTFCPVCLGEFEATVRSCERCNKDTMTAAAARQAAREELRTITADWWFPVATDKNTDYFDALVAALADAGFVLEKDMDIEQRQVDFDPIFGYCTDFQRKLVVKGAKLQEVEAIAENPTLKERHGDELHETITQWATYGQVHWGKMV